MTIIHTVHIQLCLQLFAFCSLGIVSIPCYCELYLLFGAFAGFDGVVDVFHCPLDETHCVGPLSVRVDTLLCYDSGDIPEHRLQLSLPFLV